jgi:hypothetical protein
LGFHRVEKYLRLSREVWLVGFEKDKTKGNPRAANFAKKREAFEASFVFVLTE